MKIPHGMKMPLTFEVGEHNNRPTITLRRRVQQIPKALHSKLLQLSVSVSHFPLSTTTYAFDTDHQFSSAEEYLRGIHWTRVDTLNPNCTGVIPNTFIVCGEGGNFCSDECMSKTEERMRIIDDVVSGAK